MVIFRAGTCNQFNVSKSSWVSWSKLPTSASVAALPSISFITGQQTIEHFGVLALLLPDVMR